MPKKSKTTSKKKKTTTKKEAKKETKTTKAKKSSTKKEKAKKSPKKGNKKTVSKKKTKDQKEIQATGRRKSAIARVWLFSKGKGEITVNDKDIKDFFPNFKSQNQILAPLNHLGKENDFDFKVKVKGGGFNGQAQAVQLGIARALEKFEPSWRKQLKSEGFLSRDARVKERKKPGLRRARRASQWKKR